MPFTTRRQFVQQAALAAAALYGSPVTALAKARSIFEAGEQNAVPLDPAVVPKLAAQITGRIISPGAPDYDAARLIFNRAFDQRPALIVRCTGASDVARTVEFAQNQNLSLAAHAGGHSRAGYSMCDGGLVVDLSGMRRVEVDAAQRVARAEAGSIVLDLDQATQRYGLATTSAGCPTVGIAGLTLGGGEGLLQSLYGASCDNLLSAQVVTVDGRVLEASPQSHPDLFWAIRGGGGNFGVVTALEYALHPVGEVYSGALTYSAERIPDALLAFTKFAASAPDEMNVVGELLPSEQGPKLLIHVCYFGDSQRGNDLLKPLRTPLKPVEDDLKRMSYMEAQAAGFLQAPFAHFQTNLFLPQLSAPAIAAITTAIKGAPPQFRVLIVPFSGAITRVPIGDTAFALRQPGYEVDIAGRWSAPSDKPDAVQWVRALRDHLQPLAHGVYVNQLGETSEELVREAYASNYARLAEMKRKYDPQNVLRLNQNIKPQSKS